MITGIYQSAVTLLLAVVFYAQDVWLIRRFDPERVEGSARSWSWTLFAVVMATIVVLQPILLPGLGFQSGAWWALLLQIAGLGLIFAGLALHWWARLHLRQFFGERIEYQPGQYVVDSGPYACVRHPIYTAFFLCVIGLFLVNPAVTTLLVMLYFLWDFGRAGRKEEALLCEKLAGYRDYMARTPRYVPTCGQVLRIRQEALAARKARQA